MMMNWLDINHIMIAVFGYPLSYVEAVATVSGLACVWLAARSVIWNWPVGLVNIVCLFIIFYQVQLYSDMLLQVYFFITSLYGWYVWAFRARHHEDYVRLLNRKQKTVLAVIIGAGTLLLGTFVRYIHVLLPALFTKPAAFPYIDTFVAVLSIIATILLARKYAENWVLWVVIDILCTILYAIKHVLFISLEYFILLCIATAGRISWYRKARPVTVNEKKLSM